MQKKPKQNNYSLAILLTLIGGAAIALTFFLLHCFELPSGAASWLIDLIIGFHGVEFVGRLISGNGYFFQFIDRLTDSTTLVDKIQGKSAKRSMLDIIRQEPATFIGLGLGLVVGVVIFALTVAYHLTLVKHLISVGKWAAIAIGSIFTISTYAGLGNRLGASIDIIKNAIQNKSEKPNTNINYAISVCAGVAIGMVFAFTILGLTIASAGISLPLVFTALGTISTFASSAGYIGRVFDFGLGDKTLISFKPSQFKADLTRERIGTAIGVSLGIALGLTLILAGVATLPFFGFGAAKLVAGVLLFTSCISTCGGLGNRMGHFFDRVHFEKKALSTPQKTSQETQSLPAQDPKPQLGVTLTPTLSYRKDSGATLSNPHPNPSPSTKYALGEGPLRSSYSRVFEGLGVNPGTAGGTTLNAVRPSAKAAMQDRPDTHPTPIQPRVLRPNLNTVPASIVTGEATTNAPRRRSASL